MKVVLYGATGRAGSRILHELLQRGHQVLAIARDQNALAAQEGLTTGIDDLSGVNHTAETIKGADAVISAYAPPPDNTDELVRVTKLLIEAVKLSKVPRLLTVGGAGTLEVSPGVLLIDSAYLPPEWLPIAKSHQKALTALQASDVDWTCLCPAAYFDPGERTGRFRLGVDNLISSGEGKSSVSMEDYAIAMVDELEKPQHRKQRFSVGY